MRMLSADSQLCFAVFLAAFCQTQAEVNHKTLVSSHNYDKTLLNHGFGNETRCSWNCTVITSDRTEEMKTSIANRKLIRLVVKYEKKVDDKCVNQTSHNFTEHWQISLPNNFSSFTNEMEKLSSLISFLSGSSAQDNKIRAVCTLQPPPTAATSDQKNVGVSAHDLKELFAGYPLCNAERDISQPCINITKSTGNITDDPRRDYPKEWQVVIFGVLFFILGISFVHYAPAFLCFFSPTVVKENGVRQIILEGASPVSFRSLMGNYFFSGDDGTIWHKARTFTLLVVVLPALFLPPAIALDKSFLKDYLWEGEVNMLYQFRSGALHLFHPFYLACYACYVFQAICLSFISVKYFEGKSCMVCRSVQPEISICRDQELPGQIMHHLRQQPLILLKCWRLFLRYIVNYCRMCLSVVLGKFLPCQVSVSSFLGICLFPIFLLSVPIVALMLLTAMSLVAWLSVVLTCPVSTIFSVARGTRFVSLESCSPLFTYIVILLYCCCYPPTLLGVYIVLSFAASATMKSLFWAITELFSEDSLPYLACFILVFYYVWSSYSSFTNKYQVLALTLYKHHKKSPVVTDQETERNTPIPATVISIPKELFHEACEQLMPIRVSVCILVLRVALILTFVFMVFFLAMLYDHNFSVKPVTRALLTFLSGSLPKIIHIFISDKGQKHIEDTAMDEKVSHIIEAYNNSRATEQNIEIVSM